MTTIEQEEKRLQSLSRKFHQCYGRSIYITIHMNGFGSIYRLVLLIRPKEHNDPSDFFRHKVFANALGLANDWIEAKLNGKVGDEGN